MRIKINNYILLSLTILDKDIFSKDYIEDKDSLNVLIDIETNIIQH